ncbi:(2Fe-2S)-binding protein, partial [Klebsiella pneumoniae]|nr:(2Fe-2S)-binding protein [Klebsiella pneumoniae]
GDARAYSTLRPLVGRELPAPPEQLLLPAGSGVDTGALPDDATVCSCNNVTKQDITTAITEQQLTDVPGIKACTRAGTSCGSCVPMLKTLLGECGVTTSKALCEHFPHSRSELFEIVRATGISSFSELIGKHGTGRGCDICKPAVASILASLGNGHVLDGEQAGLQDTNHPFLANMQRNGTYSV